MSLESSAIKSSLTRLYAEFGRGPLNRQIEGCPCCSSPEALERWAETPVQELAVEDLGSYVYSAMCTVGTPDDFRHFVPRLLEIVASEPVAIDFEQICNQLSRAEWHKWPERGAVEAFLRAYCQAAFNQEDALLAEGAVCGLALAGVDVLPLLESWSQSGHTSAKVSFAAFIEQNAQTIRMRQRLADAYWDGSPAQEIRVADWVRTWLRSNREP